ncbi:MAG: CfrBI family restriction endonuclease, partial [Patescibacteria group bacterium]
MESKKIKVTDLMPQVGKDLIAYTGREVITKVGADLIKNIIISILCGENVRDLTEDLTKRRVAIINGALLTLFIKGCSSVDDFMEKLPELVGDQLKSKNSKVDKDILLWLLGLTGKGVQNILRNKSVALESYIKKIKSAQRKLIDECQKSYGDLKGTLTLNNASADVNWNVVMPLLNVIGTETLAIRGAEKSMYGKLFERLVLGSCLSILGFKKIEPKQSTDCNKVFWLSSRGSKRESDATALYEAGKGVRFDIGFIGPGNTEISLDKVSRFEREMDFGRQKHFMATFIIVDRIGDRSRIVELAKKIDGTIIQMSMAFWPKVLAEKLGRILGFKHALQ